jgi:hypothetical protein
MPASEPFPVRAARAVRMSPPAGFDVNSLFRAVASPRGETAEKKPRCADACRAHHEGGPRC